MPILTSLILRFAELVPWCYGPGAQGLFCNCRPKVLAGKLDIPTNLCFGSSPA